MLARMLGRAFVVVFLAYWLIELVAAVILIACWRNWRPYRWWRRHQIMRMARADYAATRRCDHLREWRGP